MIIDLKVFNTQILTQNALRMQTTPNISPRNVRKTVYKPKAYIRDFTECKNPANYDNSMKLGPDLVEGMVIQKSLESQAVYPLGLPLRGILKLN